VTFAIQYSIVILDLIGNLVTYINNFWIPAFAGMTLSAKV